LRIHKDGSGIVSGNNGKLCPIDTTTRAEMTQVLYSLMTKYKLHKKNNIKIGRTVNALAKSEGINHSIVQRWILDYQITLAPLETFCFSPLKKRGA